MTLIGRKQTACIIILILFKKKRKGLGLRGWFPVIVKIDPKETGENTRGKKIGCGPKWFNNNKYREIKLPLKKGGAFVLFVLCAQWLHLVLTWEHIIFHSYLSPPSFFHFSFQSPSYPSSFYLLFFCSN